MRASLLPKYKIQLPAFKCQNRETCSYPFAHLHFRRRCFLFEKWFDEDSRSFRSVLTFRKGPVIKTGNTFQCRKSFFTVKKKFCTARLTKVVLNMESMKNNYFNVNSQWKTVQDVATIPLAKAKAAPTSSLPETQRWAVPATLRYIDWSWKVLLLW